MSSNFYSYPKVYVENAEEKIADEYIVLENDTACITRSIDNAKGRIFTKIMYDKALDEVLDRYAPVIRKAFIVITSSGQSLLVEKGIKPVIIEARGSRVHVAVREGDEVDERTRVAYILTRKYETRTIKAGTEGIVVLVGYIFGEPVDNYVIVIVGREHVKKLRLKRE